MDDFVEVHVDDIDGGIIPLSDGYNLVFFLKFVRRTLTQPNCQTASLLFVALLVSECHLIRRVGYELVHFVLLNMRIGAP